VRIIVINLCIFFTLLGILRVKELLGVSFDGESLKEKEITLRKPIVIHPKMNLLDLLREFRKGKSHIALITENVEAVQKKLGLNRRNSDIDKQIKIRKGQSSKNSKSTLISKYDDNNTKILGIITLEDVIEEMINIQILDEDDYEQEMKTNLKRDLKYKSTCNILLSYLIISKVIKDSLERNYKR